MFSRFAVALKKADAPCIEDLTKIIRRSFNPEPEVFHLKSAANISDYLKPMLGAFPKGIMKFRQFKMEMRNGQPVFTVRTKARGSEIFRGMANSTLFTPCWDLNDPHLAAGGIDYAAIPAAKRKPFLTEQDLNKYRKTILAAHKQWGLKIY